MSLVEKRYAQALLELSVQNLNNALSEFGDFINIYNSEMEFSDFLINPSIKVDKKLTVVRNVFSSRLSTYMLNFVLLLITKQRIKYISGIYEQFLHLVHEKGNVLEMQIISAVPLEENQLNSIREKFRVKYSAVAVESTEIVDATLIGGVKVIVGDKVYDGSVKGRIESLTELVTI